MLCFYTLIASPMIAHAANMNSVASLTSITPNAATDLDIVSNIETTISGSSSHYVVDLPPGMATTGVTYADMILMINGVNQVLTGSNANIVFTTYSQIDFSGLSLAAGDQVEAIVGLSAGGTHQLVNGGGSAPYYFGARTTDGVSNIDTSNSVQVASVSNIVSALLTSSVVSDASDHQYDFHTFSSTENTSRIRVRLPIAFTIAGTFGNSTSGVTLLAGASPVSLSSVSVTSDASYSYISIVPTTSISTPQDFTLTLNGATAITQITNPSSVGFYIPLIDTYRVVAAIEQGQQTVVVPGFSILSSGSSVPEFSTYMLMLTAAIGGLFVYQKSKDGSAIGR